jgi:glycosyltransferase involved in cell wall biosynthesis
MKLSRLLNLENHVDWRPFLPREELLQLITKANYTILLSDSEAYGISVAESLALGTPVIGSKLAALSEFQSTPGAFLFENPEDFEHIARSISSHRGQKIVIGPVGHNIISNEQSVEHHLSLYRTIINENHSI